MEDNIRQQWERFLNGHWQEKMPEATGSIPVKAREEDRTKGTAGYHTVTTYADPVTGKIKPVRPWGGFWWSERMPDELPGPGQPGG